MSDINNKNKKRQGDGEKRRRKIVVTDSSEESDDSLELKEFAKNYQRINKIPKELALKSALKSSQASFSESKQYARKMNLGSSEPTVITEEYSNGKLGGRHRGNKSRTFNPQNPQQRKKKKKNQKGKGKKPAPKYQRKYPREMGEPSVLGNYFDLDAKDFIINPDVDKEVRNIQQTDDFFDESLQLITTIVQCIPNMAGVQRFAAGYSALVEAKRAMGPEHLTTINPIGPVQVGTLWLAWVTICYDIWQNCMSGNKSLFDLVPTHYRRVWHHTLPNKYGRYSYVWEFLNFFDEFNFNVSGPPGLSLAWFQGNDSPTTGKAQLVTMFPTLSVDTISTFGVNAANSVFQFAMNETKSQLVPIMERPRKLRQKLDSSAFAIISLDNDPNFPTAMTIETEKVIFHSNTDIAELNFCDSSQSVRKSAKEKIGSVLGSGNNFYKLLHPNLMYKRLRMLYKEVNVSQLLWATLASLLPVDQVGDDQLGTSTIAQPPDSVFNTITSGMFWTVVCLEACRRFSFGSTSVALNGCLTGSTPIGGGSIWYTPVNTNNCLFASCVKEIMSEFSVHNAGERPDDPFEGIEILVPYLAIRGTRVSGNPYEGADNTSLVSAVNQIYPAATCIGYDFAAPVVPGIPNYLDVSVVNETMFLGATPREAIDVYSSALSARQGALDVDNFSDFSSSCKLSYYSLVLDNVAIPLWDDTLEHNILLLSNRFLISPQTQGFVMSLTPVYYASTVESASSYLNFYAENSALLSNIGTGMGKIVTRFFAPFAHQRATRFGYGENSILGTRIAQGEGGGHMFASFGKRLVSAGGKAIGAFASSMLSAKDHHNHIMEYANNPNKYGAVAALAYGRLLDKSF